jgi:large subunit ribosomal protein L10
MNLTEKKEFVKNLNQDISSTGILLVAHYAGLTVEKMNAFRNIAKKNDVKVKVAKNSLVKLALEGTDYESVKDDLAGPTILIFAEDIVSAAKILVDFAKENENLVIKAGSYNKSQIDKAEIINISKMPSLDEIRAKLISLIQTPATRIACVLQAPAVQCARVIEAYSKK